MDLTSPQDQGYAWIILVSSTILSCIFSYAAVALSMLLVEFIYYFDISVSQVTWIATAWNVVGTSAAFFLSGVAKYLGVRRAMICGTIMSTLGHLGLVFVPSFWMAVFGYGLFNGVGMWLIYSLQFPIIQLYFIKRRSFASGIISGGIAVGLLAAPPSVQILLDMFGVRGYLLIETGIIMNLFVCASVIIPPRKIITFLDQELSAKNEGFVPNITHSQRYIDLWKKDFVPYTVFLFGLLLTLLGHLFTFGFTPIRAEGLAIPPFERALILTFSGITTGIFRPLSGWIGNRKRMSGWRPLLFGVGSSSAGILVMVSVHAKTFASMSIFMSLYGGLSAIYFAMLGTALGDLLRAKYINFGSGLIMLCFSLAFAIVNPLTGWILDESGPSSACFAFGTCQLVGGITLAIVPLIDKYTRTDKPIHPRKAPNGQIEHYDISG